MIEIDKKKYYSEEEYQVKFNAETEAVVKEARHIKEMALEEINKYSIPLGFEAIGTSAIHGGPWIIYKKIDDTVIL